MYQRSIIGSANFIDLAAYAKISISHYKESGALA